LHCIFKIGASYSVSGKKLQRKAPERSEPKVRMRRQETDGRREEGKNNSIECVLLPTPERKKFGKTDDYRLLNQNILFQSNFRRQKMEGMRLLCSHV
jgi:hypothetical protein